MVQRDKLISCSAGKTFCRFYTRFYTGGKNWGLNGSKWAHPRSPRSAREIMVCPHESKWELYGSKWLNLIANEVFCQLNYGPISIAFRISQT
jgi:hypothetical protein